MSLVRYMDMVWKEIKDMGINMILGLVIWENIEFVEGYFIFVELDVVMVGVNVYGIKLIIFWFGLYKNGK